MVFLRPGFWKWIVLPLAGLGLLMFAVAEYFFNVTSNIVAVAARESRQPLEVGTRSGWKKTTEVSVAEINAALVERHREEGFRWCALSVRRKAAGMLERVAYGLFGAEVEVVWITPEKFDLGTTFQKGFALTTARERMKADNLWFSINANFRDPDGKPLGWVVHESRQVNPPFPKWTGYFFVKDGRPWFGPKSLLDAVPGTLEECTQGYPSVMRDHTVFPYVDLEPNRFFDGKKITYRSLAGVRRDGVVVFVLSGDGGVMNVAEVTELARKLEVQHATLLDGGRALQYSIRTDNGPWHFHAFNTAFDISHRWLERQRSPVYIGARRKAPQIIVGNQ